MYHIVEMNTMALVAFFSLMWVSLRASFVMDGRLDTVHLKHCSFTNLTFSQIGPFGKMLDF